MGGHHKAKNWGCPDTVDTNGSSPMNCVTSTANFFISVVADNGVRALKRMRSLIAAFLFIIAISLSMK